MIDAPQIVQTNEQLTAVIHFTIPRAEIGNVMGPAIAEILSVIAVQGLAPAGPCFSFHRARPTAIFDFEVGFPIESEIAPNGRVMMSKLPAAKVIRTNYRGGYDGLAAAWGEFCIRIDSEGIAARESLWERYLSGPESSLNPDDWCTELNRPLAA
jgi:effector-binding domain-containing protein